MRLWSIHPKYLDARGLVALWREGLLAKTVLQNRTRGYRHHPQLTRFRSQPAPVAAIDGYLRSVLAESVRRGYAFDKRKLGRRRDVVRIAVSSGQLAYELKHLRRKLRVRDAGQFAALSGLKKPLPHPLFRVRKGAVETWERM